MTFNKVITIESKTWSLSAQSRTIVNSHKASLLIKRQHLYYI